MRLGRCVTAVDALLGSQRDVTFDYFARSAGKCCGHVASKLALCYYVVRISSITFLPAEIEGLQFVHGGSKMKAVGRKQ